MACGTMRRTEPSAACIFPSNQCPAACFHFFVAAAAASVQYHHVHATRTGKPITARGSASRKSTWTRSLSTPMWCASSTAGTSRPASPTASSTIRSRAWSTARGNGTPTTSPGATTCARSFEQPACPGRKRLEAASTRRRPRATKVRIAAPLAIAAASTGEDAAVTKGAVDAVYVKQAIDALSVQVRDGRVFYTYANAFGQAGQQVYDSVVVDHARHAPAMRMLVAQPSRMAPMINEQAAGRAAEGQSCSASLRLRLDAAPDVDHPAARLAGLLHPQACRVGDRRQHGARRRRARALRLPPAGHRRPPSR